MPNTPKMNSSIVDEEFPVIREEYKLSDEMEKPTTETEEVTQTMETETSETPVEEESTEQTEESSEPVKERAIELHEIQAEEGEDLLDMLDLFDDEDDTGATGSGEKPKLIVKPNDMAHLYDHRAATAAKEKARMMAPKMDGAKATELVEAENALVAEGENVELDDLDWLNDEEDNYVFEDLFPEIEGEALELQDGTAPMLAIEGDAADQQEDIKMNPLEEALVRLKKKRGREEMTPEQAENVMEELICRMTTAADEDGETIRKNMAKARLQRMMEKEKSQPNFLGKKENHQRFAKLFKIAEFPNSKEMMKSFWDEKTEKDEVVKSFSSKKARAGTVQLLKRYPEEPAMQKMMILNYCCKEIKKPDYMNWFVTFGGLSVLKTWLSPNPDGTLPALTLRTEVLTVLTKLPVSNAALRKSGLGKEVNALLKSSQETLPNRKMCQELISKWLSNVLETETSIKRHRMDTQHRMQERAQPAKKRKLTAEQQKAQEKEVQQRRHPQMFQKPSHNFVVEPKQDDTVQSLAARQAQFRQTRKGKIAKCAGELRALRPAARHVHVDISGSKMNTAKGTF